MSADFVPIGRIARPFGVRGGVRIHLYNPDTSLLAPGLVVQLEQKNGPARHLKIKSSHGKGRVVFEEIDDRDDAKALSQLEVSVQREHFLPLDDDAHYLVDFLEATVEKLDGEEVGTIIDIQEMGGQPKALIQTSKGHEILIPFVPGIVTEADADKKKVVIDPPEGLLELPQPSPPPKKKRSHQNKKNSPVGS